MAVINNATNYQVTQYNTITGGANNLLNNVAPSATSGVPLISQGSSSQPLYGTAVVAGGGTGGTTFTAYGPITAGTTATGAFQSTGTPGSSGTLFQSAGTTSVPGWTTSTYPATNAVNTLLYASSANVMGALATADNGVLITSASGVPSWLADGTTGQVLTATTGSPPSWAAASGPGGLTQVTGTLTNSQIKNLHGTPISVIAAPGSGKVIWLVSAVGKLVYGGTNAFTAGASQTITLTWGSGTSQTMSSLLNNAALTDTKNNYVFATTGPTTDVAATALENTAIYAYNSVATEISGNAANNNTVTYSIFYYITDI